MSDVTALVADRALQQRLRSAFAAQYCLRLARDADQLWAALRERPVVLVIVEASRHVRTDIPALVRAVRARYPSIPVVAFCHGRPGVSADVLDLARAEVHGLVITGIDDHLELATLLAHAARRSTVDDVLAHVPRHAVPKRAVQILRQFLESAGRELDVAREAELLGVPLRALRNYLKRVGVPGPQELAAWCRLLVAARLLDEPTNTVERVAHDLQFSSGNALRNRLRRHAGLSPKALRDLGGYVYLRGLFIGLLLGSSPVGPSESPESPIPAESR